MNLFLLRHASAGVRRPNPVLDRSRPLDKDGKRYCLQLAHVLYELKIQFDLIVSSPLKRSVQTASLVGNEIGYESQILMSNALAPAATFQDFQHLLSECRQYENMLVVGHNPNLTQFLASLLVPRERQYLRRFVFAKDPLHASLSTVVRAHCSGCLIPARCVLSTQPQQRARAERSRGSKLPLS